VNRSRKDGVIVGCLVVCWLLAVTGWAAVWELENRAGHVPAPVVVMVPRPAPVGAP
jgi:hypothetical protein